MRLALAGNCLQIIKIRRLTKYMIIDINLAAMLPDTKQPLGLLHLNQLVVQPLKHNSLTIIFIG